MNRIDQAFAELRGQKRGTVIPFITAGYPSLAVTEELLLALDAAGLRVCEIGIPFSDPVADGPVIQHSMTEALKTGVHPADVFAMVRRIRSRIKLALVAMVSFSIVFRIGPRKFIHEAKEAGIDGFIFPDLPLEEAGKISRIAQEEGTTSSLLIAPTTPPERAVQIARACSGFVYVLARTGITGERDQLPEGLADRVAAIRKITPLPIGVGFGIGKPAHVAQVTGVAEGAIVGSALVRRLGDAAGQDPRQAAAAVAEFVIELERGAIGAGRN